MATVRSFGGKTPRVGDGVFVAETAVLVGDVEVGPRSSVWYGVVMRGDVYYIRIGSEVSVQDNTVVHVTSGRHPTMVGNRVTIGHSVVLHGCTIEDECIIGMGAIILDRARVARNCIVGAISNATFAGFRTIRTCRTICASSFKFPRSARR